MSRAVMQQALKALEDHANQYPHMQKGYTVDAITALKQALAELDSDYERGFVDGMNLQTKGSVDKAVNRMAEPRPIQECYGDCPTNPKTCPNPCNFEGRPKPEQKPQTTHWEGCEAVHPECKATPRKPLTDEEIERNWELLYDETGNIPDYHDFARAVEKAHGIGEQHE